MILVIPKFDMASFTFFSVDTSRLAVPSSSNKSFGFLYNALANKTRAFCPPDKDDPISPTNDSYCIGIFTIS